MKTKILCLLFLVPLWLVPNTGPTETGVLIGPEKREKRGDLRGSVNEWERGRRYLLAVALNRYRYWPPLRGPVKETEQVKDALMDCGLIDKVKEMYNEQASKEAIRNYLLSLQEGGENALEEEDSLIIYFSGHGQAVEEEGGKGYWIPYDGSHDAAARCHWLGNSELIGLLKKIKAKQLLIISDACFSGTLVEREIRGEWKGHSPIQRKVVRQVLTSGGIERVPGESVFAALLVDAIYENRLSRLPVGRLHAAIAEKVSAQTGNRPEYGNLKRSGATGADSFILYSADGAFCVASARD